MATVEEIIDESLQRVQDALADADPFLQELRNSASEEYTMTFPDAETEQGHVLNRIEHSLLFAVTPDITGVDNGFNATQLTEKLAYATEFLDRALSTLGDDIDNGGYGIRVEDEVPLWDRGRDRISRAAEAELGAAERSASTRGFSLPTGAQLALAQRAAQSVTERLAELNREIAIKRADLYVAQRNFALAQSIGAGVQMAQVKISEFSAELDLARMRLAQSTEKARAYLEANNQNIRLISEKNNTQLSWEKLQFDEWAKSVDSYYKGYADNLDRAKLELEALNSAASIRMRAAEKGVELYSSLVTSAQNSISAITTLAE